MSREDRTGGAAPRPAGAAGARADQESAVLDGPTAGGLSGLPPPERAAVVGHRRWARWGIRALGAIGALVGTVIIVQFVYYPPLGSPVLSIYDPELVYVTAYLEEDRLEGVAPGNRVRIWVDAFPDVLSGRVVWIGQAIGANFALLPRDVSSGEFTKVTQRLPVRVAVDRGPRWRDLRPGLSVTVAIAHGPGDPAWAAAEAERQLARVASGVSPTAIPDGEG